MGDERRARFEAVFDAHFGEVLRFVLARCDAETAKDVTAETFTAAWRNVDDLPAHPRAWLFAVARRKLIDHYRAAGRRDALSVGLGALVANEADPAEGVAAHERVRAAFGQLTPEDQELLRLLAWDGLSRSEAATVLGCSKTAFAVRLHRARRRLRAALDDKEEAGEREPDLEVKQEVAS